MQDRDGMVGTESPGQWAVGSLEGGLSDNGGPEQRGEGGGRGARDKRLDWQGGCASANASRSLQLWWQLIHVPYYPCSLCGLRYVAVRVRTV